MVSVKQRFLFVNFKAYREASGKNAVLLAKHCAAVSKETGVSVVPVVSAVDLRRVCQSVSIPVFCQHCDALPFGKGNGKLVAEALKEAGASGVVVNHAEDPVSNDIASKVVFRAKEAGLQVLACAENDLRSRELAKFNPDFLAIELPQLIGTLQSVSKVDPGLVKRSVGSIASVSSSVIPIMGAGVASAEDSRASVSLGCRGVFVSAAIVLSKDQKKACLDIATGLK